MIVKRFFDEKLAQTSYMIGCAATGEALVMDPSRDVEQYVSAAARERLTITHIAETHIHADFVSGSRELAERTGGRLHLSAEGGSDWSYGYGDEYDAVMLRDGDSFMVGNVKVDVLHTPGHTPEHLSFVITDTAGADRPMGVLTGDFIFVGDVGRPDLLEKAAGYAGTMEAGARTLFHSLQRFKRDMPDYVQIWPGHGAGSACGKSLGAVPQSTLGYERLFNWGLATEDEDAFVAAVLAGQPEPPKYFAEMKRINRDGPRVLGHRELPPRLQATQLEGVLRGGGLVIDTRHARDFAAGHVPGTISIPLNRSFATWAGWLVSYDRDFHLLIDQDCDHCLEEAVHDLSSIGLDRVAGWFGLDTIDANDSDEALQRVPRISAAELASRIKDDTVEVIDVRNASEWEAGHIPGVQPDGGETGVHVFLGLLRDRLNRIPRDRPLAVHCQSGSRSAIAASLLQAEGFSDVTDVPGGFAEWEAENRPVERAVDARSPATV